MKITKAKYERQYSHTHTHTRQYASVCRHVAIWSQCLLLAIIKRLILKMLCVYHHQTGCSHTKTSILTGTSIYNTCGPHSQQVIVVMPCG